MSGLRASLGAAAHIAGEEIRSTGHRARGLVRDFAVAPQHRALRWIVLIGFAVRFVLAPLTAWGVDTTFFALSDSNLLFAGSAYRADTFYNPPLGPLLQLPGVALLAQFESARNLIPFVPGLVPVATTTGMFAPYLPSPAFLFVLKFPLLLADGAVTVLLYRLLRLEGNSKFAIVAAAAWFLNPLVIWASAVHGEVDTLGALPVVGFLYCWRVGQPFGGGLALGLGAAAKLYPALLLPLAAVLFVGTLRSTGAGRRLGQFALGVGVAAVPFLADAPGFAEILAHQSGNNTFGGLSVLIVLNTGLEPWATGVPPALGSILAVLFVAALPATVLVTTWAVARRPESFARTAPGALGPVALIALTVVAAALLAVLSPQAENFVGLVPLLLLAVPVLGRAGTLATGAISSIAFAQYLSLLGPLAFFYPLARILGPGAFAAINGPTIAYGTSVGMFGQASMWVVLGLLGGATTLLVWYAGLRVAIRGFPRPAATSGKDRIPIDSAAAGPPPSVRPETQRRFGSSPRRWAPVASTASMFAVLVIVVVGSTGLSVESRAAVPLFEASVTSVDSGPNSSTAEVSIHVGSVAMAAHVGLIPGSRWASGPVYFFGDPNYPSPYATYTQAVQVAELVGVSLGEDGVSAPVSLVDAAQLPAVLASRGPSTLVVVGGLLPDSVLAGQSSPVEKWILGGGSLVWAGGPLGYAEGHPLPDGTFYWDPLLWQGQLDLVGFPLTDPGNPAPLSASTPSAIATTLGLEYNGTPSGANVTRVAQFGGTVLGWTTGPGPDGASPRASLVSIPVGAGRVLFFGGAFVAATRPQQYVPLADFTLSADLTLLFQTGFAAHGAGGASLNLELASGSRRTVAVSGPFVSGEALLIVSAPSVPVFFGSYAVYLQFGPAGTAGTVLDAEGPT
ncbi:MAG: hypothetical protein L3K00_08310 [Thermoplasmata archaeon]|nr:hypothetical protein [Thermoplasmata archaeon]